MSNETSANQRLSPAQKAVARRNARLELAAHSLDTGHPHSEEARELLEMLRRSARLLQRPVEQQPSALPSPTPTGPQAPILARESGPSPSEPPTPCPPDAAAPAPAHPSAPASPPSSTQATDSNPPPGSADKPDQESPPPHVSPNPASPPLFTGIIPARMLNQFVYCPRLFYYEFVEGVFLHNADTLRGAALHQRVDAGTGAMPPPAPPAASAPAPADPSSAPEPAREEIIHSRSVELGSDRLGVIAKIDLVEIQTGSSDLFTAVEVCPVDYKAGSPRLRDDVPELWDGDRMQLALQCLILRDNGYQCREGIIYYRGTKQRVRLELTPDLEQWVLQQIDAARRCAVGPIPPPLVASPKCPRCSLAPICLPDETRLLSDQRPSPNTPSGPSPATASPHTPGPSRSPEPVRRLMAPRDDTRALYLNTQGLRVGRKEETLQISQEGRVIDEVRIRDLSHVALFGNIQITTQAIQALCEAEVPITFFSMGGWFYGLTRGHHLKNVFLRIEQFRTAADPQHALPLARKFVHGKIRNHRTLLMRNHLEPPPRTLALLKHYAEAALSAPDLPTLLGIEGEAARTYFEQFSGMIKVTQNIPEEALLAGSAPAPSPHGPLQFTFNFTQRNRRPPTDPVNALLSLAYSLLTKDCTLALLAVGFDPYVGFYHQPRFGRPALALDLMEEFRPLIAESVVLTAINNRIITPEDFVSAGRAVNLAPRARRRFFEVYEQRINSLLTHPLFDYKVSYRRALELQARLLAKTLTGEISEYIPLTTR